MRMAKGRNRVLARVIDNVVSFAARRGYDRLFRFAYTQAGSGWFDRNVDNDNGTATRVTALYITYFSDKPLEKLLEALADERYDLVEVLLDNKNFAKNLTAAAVGGIFGRLSEDGLVKQMEFMGNKGFLDLVEVRDRVDVLKAAIVKKEIQSVEYLCSVEDYFAGMSSDDKNMLLAKAATRRARGLVKILRSNENFFKGVSAGGRSKALYKALTSGSYDTAEYLLGIEGYFAGMSRDDKDMLLAKAATRRARGLVEILCSNENFFKGVSAGGRGRAFYKALTSGNYDAAKYLLGIEGYFDDMSATYRGVVLCEVIDGVCSGRPESSDASKKLQGLWDELKKIKSYFDDIDFVHKGKLFASAIKAKRFDVLDHLREVMPNYIESLTFTPELLQKPVVTKVNSVEFADDGESIIIDSNNTSGEVEGIGLDYRGRALYEAIIDCDSNDDDPSLLNYLKELGINFNNISPYYKGVILCHFASMGNVEKIQSLEGALNDVSDYDKEVAFINAAASGKLEAVKSLYKIIHDLSVEDLGKAFCEAAAAGKLEVVKYLRTIGNLRAEDINKAFYGAVAAGELEVVKYLYDEFKGISIEAKGKAFYKAAAAGNMDMLCFLSTRKGYLDSLTPDDRGRAYYEAKKAGHESVMNYLEGLCEGSYVQTVSPHYSDLINESVDISKLDEDKRANLLVALYNNATPPAAEKEELAKVASKLGKLNLAAIRANIPQLSMAAAKRELEEGGGLINSLRERNLFLDFRKDKLFLGKYGEANDGLETAIKLAHDVMEGKMKKEEGTYSLEDVQGDIGQNVSGFGSDSIVVHR
jgi:hypothetical protein